MSLRNPYPPELFLTYAYDEPEHAPVIDVSHSVAEARQMGNHGRPCYSVKKQGTVSANGLPEYGDETFVEILP